jgi:hypothetical protein
MRTALGTHRPRISALLALSAAAVAASAGAAQEPVPAADEIRVGAGVFESFAFGGSRTGDWARHRLERQLDDLLDQIRDCCDLSADQEARLRLAARGDVERCLDRVRRRGAEVAGQTVTRSEFKALLTEGSHIFRIIQGGFFGPESLLAKAAASTLDPGQLSRLNELALERTEARYRSEMNIHLFEIDAALGLTDAQRERLVEAIWREIGPPLRHDWGSPYNEAFLNYLIAVVPEDALRPIVNDEQWQIINHHRELSSQPARFLFERGLLRPIGEDEGDDPAPDVPIFLNLTDAGDI